MRGLPTCWKGPCTHFLLMAPAGLTPDPVLYSHSVGAATLQNQCNAVLNAMQCMQKPFECQDVAALSKVRKRICLVTRMPHQAMLD